MKNKRIRQLAGFRSSQEKEKEIDKLLENNTEITIIKKATAEEIVEHNKTFWDKIKEKVHKI